MIVRRTSVVDVGGVVGCRKPCEEKENQELKHICVQGAVSGSSGSSSSSSSIFTLAINPPGVV